MKEGEKYKSEDMSFIEDCMVEQTHVMTQMENDTFILDCQNDLKKDTVVDQNIVYQHFGSEKEDETQGLSYKGRFVVGGVGGTVAAMAGNAVGKIKHIVGSSDESESDKIVNSKNLIHENMDSNLEGTDSNVAQGVSDEMSFGQAFRMAREEVGPDGVFEWRGNLYGTRLKSELKDLEINDDGREIKDSEQIKNEIEQNDNLIHDLSEDESIISDEQVEILGIENIPENARLELAVEGDGVLVEVEGDVVFASIEASVVDDNAEDIEIESVEQNTVCNFDMSEMENMISQMDFGVDTIDSEEIDYLNGIVENEM